MGASRITSDGRVVANLTVNEGIMSYCMMVSILTIQLPLNDLNGTSLTCQSFELQDGARFGAATVLFRGE